ncbi:geraniol 8-hydroxylase-like [Silene latifolia]|uniref:geraniol 8-hydroxylase-like n=1 Tax=Silene latifolia TaxID=37657 RepID=UPI003D775431
MDYQISLLIIPFILLITLFIFFKSSSPKTKLHAPPGPKPWPIIGNLHQLGDKPHQNVARLSKEYGPIMSLKLGSIPTIVISCPKIAQEMFLKHDLAFSSRKVPVARKVTNHDKFSIIWLPVCPKWRTLRKVATIQLFSKFRLDSSQVLREMKVNESVNYTRNCWKNGVPVDIGKAGFTTLLNMMSNTLFSTDLGSHDYRSSSEEFKDIVWHLLEEGSKLNVSDFFPLLEVFDFQGVLKRNKFYFKKMLGIFDEIIEQRLSDGDSKLMVAKDDVLDTLLKLVKDNELSIDDVKHLLTDLFLAGSDTTFSTLEWAMTELLHSPQKMTRAQNEIDQVHGKNNNRSIQESDISKLPYIQAIVKETLRLHPPAPILVPHTAQTDVELSGYFVPKDTEVWVNVWSMGRDPILWKNPNLFLPERFMEGNSEIDLKHQDFRFIPFGAGRRMCPGMPLAYRMVHLMLANLIYSFNWKYENGVRVENVDGQETFGLSMQRIDPLLLIPIPR